MDGYAPKRASRPYSNPLPACWTDCAATFVTSSLNDDDDPSAAVVDAAWAKNDTRAHRGMDVRGAGEAAVTGVLWICACDWAARRRAAAVTPAASATTVIRRRAVIGGSYALPVGWQA